MHLYLCFEWRKSGNGKMMVVSEFGDKWRGDKTSFYCTIKLGSESKKYFNILHKNYSALKF